MYFGIYNYLTFEEECFKGGAEHPRTCVKDDDQRKCIRRISARFIPTVSGERLAARATECLGQADGARSGNPARRPPRHFQSWTVNDSVGDLTRILQDLVFLPGLVDTCVKCGGPKGPRTQREPWACALTGKKSNFKVSRAWSRFNVV